MRDIVHQLCKRRLTHQSAVFDVEAMAAKVSPAQEVIHVELTSSLRLRERRGGFLVLDCGKWPLDLDRVAFSCGGQAEVRGGLVIFPILNGSAERGVLELNFRWPHGMNQLGSVLAIPSMLPSLVRPSTELSDLSVPTVAVRIDEGAATPLLVSRPKLRPLSRSGADLGEHSAVLGFTAAYTWRVTGTVPDMAVSNSLLRTAGEERLGRICSVVEKLITECAALYGTTPPQQLVLASTEDLVHNRGLGYSGIIFLSQREIGWDGGEPFDIAYELARQVCGLWWGTTCQIAGPSWWELEAAIAVATSLLAAERVTNMPAPQYVPQYLDDLATRSALLDWLDRVRGRMRMKVVGPTALRVYQEERRTPGFLAELTQRSWGRTVPTQDLVQRLGLALAHGQPRSAVARQPQ